MRAILRLDSRVAPERAIVRQVRSTGRLRARWCCACSGCRVWPRLRSGSRNHGDPRNILEGNWQSCQQYGRSLRREDLDHYVNSVPQYRGASRSATGFRHLQGRPGGAPRHESRENLLKPYRVSMEGSRARQQLGNPVAEPELHGIAWRRLDDGLRELVHPARPARQTLTVTAHLTI